MAEAPRTQRGYVSGKSDAENIDVVQHAVLVSEAKHIASPRSASDQGFDRMLNTAVGEIAQKRVAGTNRQKGERRSFFKRRWKQSVDDFVRSAVAANRDEFTIAFGPRGSGEFACMAIRRGLPDVNVQSRVP